ERRDTRRPRERAHGREHLSVRAARDSRCAQTRLAPREGAPAGARLSDAIPPQSRAAVLALDRRDCRRAHRRLRARDRALLDRASPVCLVWSYAGELRRALWAAAAEASERTLRADGTAALVEHEPRLFESHLLSSAASLRSSRERTASLPGIARFRRRAPPAERLPRLLRSRRDSAALVQSDGSQAARVGRRRYR